MIRIDRHEGGVAALVMDHGRDNRLHPELVAAMLGALDELAADADVRAVVLTSANDKFFSNGLDLAWMMKNAGQMADVVGYLTQVNALFKRVTLYPKPVVAALTGHTFAAGLFLAAHCDFRLMREDRGWVCMPEVDIDIPLLPGMIAICQETMSVEGFRRMYFQGARLTGPEAVAIGFVDAVHPQQALLPAAVELAAALGQKKTPTYAEMKRRIRADVGRLLDEDDAASIVPTLTHTFKMMQQKQG